ncbi:MAG: ABC transporter permease [Lachnospiraceae bacterium]|nr:ABC transporter permease [Lachnospiraceae bacterium]
MNTLRMALKLIKKKRWALLLLSIEMIISSVVILSIVGRMEHIEKTKGLIHIFDGTGALYFHTYLYYSPDTDVLDSMDSSIKNKVQISSMYEMYLNLDNSSALNALAYDELIIDRMKPKMNEGIWISEYSGDNVPIVTIGDDYHVGDIVKLSNAQTCEVVGTLSSQSYVICYHGGSDSGKASYINLMKRASDFSVIIPYGDGKYKSVNKDALDDLFDEEKKMVYAQKSDFPEVIEELKKWGYVSSIEQMQENFSSDNREFMYTNGMVALIFFVLTVIGIGGINFIQGENNMKTYTIMYMLGMTRRKCMFIEALNTFSVIGISFAAFVLLSKKIIPVATDNNSETDWRIYIFILLFYVFIYAISSLPAIIRAGKYNIIELYKKGKE